jgi:hypothetical protein
LCYSELLEVVVVVPFSSVAVDEFWDDLLVFDAAFSRLSPEFETVVSIDS